MAKISDKHKAFCKALLEYKFNQTKAYQKIYPSAKSPRTSGSLLLTKVDVQDYLAKLIEKQDKKELVTVDEVIKGIKDVLSKCINPKKDEYYKEGGALRALELLGKYKAMWTDKTEITGKDGKPLSNTIKIEFVKPKK